MISKILPLALMVTFITSATAQCAEFGVQVTQGTNVAVYKPITGAGNVTSFYKYDLLDGDSYNGAIPVTLESAMFMYEDSTSTNCSKSLVMVHRAITGGEITFKFPGDWTSAEVKDGGAYSFNTPVTTVPLTTVEWNWRGSAVTEGMAKTVGDTFVCAVVTPTFTRFNGFWVWKEPSGSYITLEQSQPVTICVVAAPPVLPNDQIDCEESPCGTFRLLCRFIWWIQCRLFR